MGCNYSKLESKEMISRCKARKRYLKQFVKARNAFSASHNLYLRSLRNTGAALLQFATAESLLHRHNTPPDSPPLSPIFETWTTTTTATTTANTSSTHLPPPPPPPPPPSSSWDFWDPFMPLPETTNITAPPPSAVRGSDDTAGEMPVVVSSESKELMEIVKELDEYFLRAAESGGKLSSLLEVSMSTFSDESSSGKSNRYGKSLNPFLSSWSSSPRFNGLMKFDCNGMAVDGVAIPGSHCSTVERLLIWEKKLYQEVKNIENLKIEHEKKTEQLRKMEMKKGGYLKIEKAKKEVEKLESRIMVAGQAIESSSQEIIRLRESELYPQLLELVKGLMCMWRSLYESHQVQTHIVQQLKDIKTVDQSTAATTALHRQSTLQLELEVQKWHLSFCSLVKSQQDYIQSLTGWLRLSLFQFSKNSPAQTKQDSAIYSLCEEWQVVADNAPDKAASEGINAFYTVVHAIVVQQAEEQKQKRRLGSISKEVENKMTELRSLERKYPGRASDKRAKVEALMLKAEEEKVKYEKSKGVTRATTLNNLQMGLPHVFQAVTGFANAWTRAFESVCNRANDLEEVNDGKSLMK